MATRKVLITAVAALAWIVLGLTFAPPPAAAAAGDVSVLIGSARGYSPAALAVDAGGDVYFSDWNRPQVFKLVPATGQITLTAGNGSTGYSGDGGSATAASLEAPTPWALGFDPEGNLYLGDQQNYRIRKVDASTGLISTVAGNGSTASSGDGGLATQAGILMDLNYWGDGGLALDAAGNLYISDGNPGISEHRSIRKVDAATGLISTVATFPQSGPNSPLAVDGVGNLYFVDSAQGVIRKLDTSTGVSTGVAHPVVDANYIAGLAVDQAGNLYYGSSNEGGAYKVVLSTGVTTQVYGSGHLALDLAVDRAGNLYVADMDEGIIKIEGAAPPTDHPPTAVDDAVTTNEDAGIPVAVLANDSDPDGDALAVTAVTQGTYGDVTLDPDGTITYTPNADFNGSDDFTYTVGDGQGGSATGTVSVTVTPVNDPPSFTMGPDQVINEDAGPQTVAEGEPLTFTVTATDVDADGALALSLEGAPTGVSLIDHQDGTATFAWTPGYDQAGEYTLIVSASDGELTASRSVVVTVTNITRTVTASVGANGSITPAGVTVVDHGADQTFAIAADAGYRIEDVVVDGVSVGALASYTFGAVTADHIISASFADLTPPVVKAPADVTAEATGPQTAVSIGAATATDAVGVVSLTSNAPATFPLGATTVTWTARDAAGNSGIAVQTVLVRDTTAPVVTAALTAVSRSRDEDEDEDSNFYQVTAAATDLVDLHPAVSALIAQPLTSTSPMVVRYKADRKNRIQIKAERSRLRVVLSGPSEATLLVLWTQVLSAGGFTVVDDQTVQLIPQKDKVQYEASYSFDRNLKLTSAKGPGLKLVVWASDASGNQSPRLEAVPGKSTRGDRDDDRRDAKPVSSLPAGFALSQNYPNPFNPSTTIPYAVAEAGEVKLSVYNALGQQVRVLVDQMQMPGSYAASWDGRDDRGQVVSSGIYLYRLQAGEQEQVQKMLLAR